MKIVLTGALGALVVVLAGCSQSVPQSQASGPPPMPKPGANVPKMTIEEIGKSSFGTSFRSAGEKGDAVEYELIAVADGAPAEKYRRMVLLAGGALGSTMRNQPKAAKVRFTVFDPKDAAKKLVVFTLSREDAAKVGGHGSWDVLLSLAKVEYADPEYKDVTVRKGPQ